MRVRAAGPGIVLRSAARVRDPCADPPAQRGRGTRLRLFAASTNAIPTCDSSWATVQTRASTRL
eukprot:3153012-Prymnesium_polylepis.1